MMMTSIKKTKSISKKTKLSFASIPRNIRSLSAAKRITIPIFIKLLATKIVASNFFGRRKSVLMMSNAFELLSCGSKSAFVREKRATSAPEISAEQHSRTMRNNPPNKRVVSMVLKK